VNIADSPAVVSIAASLPSASEAGPTNGQFTFTRSGGNIAAALIVNYSVGGTATNGVDYGNIPGSITIPANQTSATQAVTVVQDNVVEAGGETVVLTLTPNAAYTIGAPSTATVNIVDSPAVVSIAATIASASEVGPTNGQFTFTRSGGNLAAALIVNYSVGGTATNNVDYINIPGAITIPANQTSATQAITVLPDNVVEAGGETVVLTLTPNPAYTISGGPAQVNIADNPAVVTIAASIPNASEAGPTNGQFTFTRSGGNLAAALVVNYSVGGSATNNTDYSNIPGSITIPGGQPSATLAIVPVPDGNSAEGTETVILTISPNAAYTISGGPATVNIADGVADAAPTVTTVSPANGSNTAAFNADIIVNFSEGVAVSGNWFQIVCASGTRTPANSVVSGNSTATTGTGFTINPAAIFTQGESCTGTIFAANISDLDANDPPDNMVVNFTWTFNALTDAAPAVTAVSPANGSNTAAFNADISVSFNEIVQVSGNWFQIVCANSGTRTPANSVVSGNFTSTTGTVITINPSAIFTLGESCTGTIFAAGISDTDTNDPPDNPVADFTWTFSATNDLAPAVTAVSPANGSNTAPFNTDISVSFSEIVQISGNWFQIVCANSGTRTPANSVVSGNFTSTTGTVININPNVNFTQGESCTGTIFAAGISDTDTNDPPDNPVADFTWTFSALTDAAPLVTAVSPANGSNTAPFNTDISVSFNEIVQVSGNWFQIVCTNSGTRTPANSVVSGNFTSTTGTVININPNASFTQGESCTGTIFAAGISDTDTNDPPDNPVADFTWTFSALTDAAPLVTAVSPANGSNTAPFNTDISVSFNEIVQVSGNWFQIVCTSSGTRTPANSVVSGNFTSTTGTVININPNASFMQGESCTGTIFAAGISDTDTNDPPDNPVADFTWTFNALTDAAPAVTAVSPANGSNTSPFNADISVSFSEIVQVSGNWFQIVCTNSGTRTPANSVVSGNFTSTTGTVININPNASFTQGESCTGTIFAAGISDTDTNDPPENPVADFVWTFNALTDVAPAVTAVSPANGTSTAPFNTDISVSFNEIVQVSGNWFQIVCTNSGTRTPANSVVSGNFTSTTGTVININPNANLTQGESCTGTIFAAGISDTDTNDPPENPVADFVWTFNALTDAAPLVTAVSPANGSNTAPSNTDISLSFNEIVQVSGSWFQIVCTSSGTRTPANSVVSGNFTSTTGTVININPNVNFTQGESCTGTIFAAGISDTDTNDPPDVMAANFVWSFSVP
jgi:methionine-rich copper-binding protein CopC